MVRQMPQSRGKNAFDFVNLRLFELVFEGLLDLGEDLAHLTCLQGRPRLVSVSRSSLPAQVLDFSPDLDCGCGLWKVSRLIIVMLG